MDSELLFIASVCVGWNIHGAESGGASADSGDGAGEAVRSHVGVRERERVRKSASSWRVFMSLRAWYLSVSMGDS